MASKLMLLLAIVRGAELLILDEPTDGLDPSVTEDVLRELVSLEAANRTTIFFSSHQLEEVERIADHVCIIDRGKAVVAGALDDLKAQYQRIQVVVDRELREPVRWVDGVVKVRQEGRTLSFACLTPSFAISTLLATFLDDAWQAWGGLILIVALRGLASLVSLPSAIDPFWAVAGGSPLVTHTVPWGAIVVSLTFAAAVLVAAAKIVQSRDY